jgi:hypothetical protein
MSPGPASVAEDCHDDHQKCDDNRKGEDHVERQPEPSPPSDPLRRPISVDQVLGRRAVRHAPVRLRLIRRVPSAVLGLPPALWGAATAPAILSIHPPVGASLIHRRTPTACSTPAAKPARPSPGKKSPTPPPTSAMRPPTALVRQPDRSEAPTNARAGARSASRSARWKRHGRSLPVLFPCSPPAPPRDFRPLPVSGGQWRLTRLDPLTWVNALVGDRISGALDRIRTCAHGSGGRCSIP